MAASYDGKFGEIVWTDVNHWPPGVWLSSAWQMPFTFHIPCARIRDELTFI
jgi:hypothetical protein